MRYGKWIALSALLMALQIEAAQVKDVSFACGKKSCDLTFNFASVADLPNYFQKFDSKKGKWTVAFAASDFKKGNGSFVVDSTSEVLKDVRIFQESGKQGLLLKFEWSVGKNVQSAENPVSLKGADFKISFTKAKAKSWKLSKVIVAAEKKAALEAKKAAAQKAAEEKKAALEAKKAAEKQVAAEKKAALEAEKAAAQKAAEEKKAALEAKKAAEKQAAADKKAALEAKKAAEKQAAEEKKAALEAKKAAEKQAAADKKAALEAEKAAEKQLALEAEQKALDAKTVSKDSVKKVSALLEGIAEMTAVVGFGNDQFRMKLLMPVTLEQVSYLAKKSVILISAAGPAKSPVFKVNAPSMVKSVSWTADGLQLQLRAGVRPTILVREGVLILQSRETIATEGYSFWNAKPDGVRTRRWVKQIEKIPTSLDAFAAVYEKDSKKVISASQTFFLSAAARELIVIADEIELYEAADENSTVISRLSFGDRLESIELVGLYQKVQYGPRVGFINKRSVSFRDELSAVQSERLKQLAVAKGESPDSVNARFASLTDNERVMYSSFGRRDPFVDVKGLVEEGINIDQMELVGIIWESEEPMAILSDVRTPTVSYTIKEGDKVLNGKVLKITQTDVLFLIQEFGVSRRYSMGLPDKFGGQ